MDWMVLDDRSRYHDLTLFGICVIVDDDVTELYGVVESDNEEIKHDQDLESYLVETNPNVFPQSMARTKQTARKTDNKGKLPPQSSGGQTLATFANRRSPRFLDSDSDLERAANMFGINTRQSPARGSSARGSPARGTKRPATPSSSSSGSPRKSPPLRSPARGAPPRGVPGQGTSRGAGRSVPVLTVNPQPRGSRGQPGQAGFIQRGAREASRSSPRFALPSFSTEEEDNDDDDEVDFPNQGDVQRRRQIVQRGNQPWKPIAAKNLDLIMAPKWGKSGFTEIAAWNRSARQGVYNETKRGWMAKHEWRQDARGRLLRKRRPGTGALYEIRFYQKSTCFLIPMIAFQRYVRQVALDVALGGKEYRWQARALFALQQAAEAYMVAYLCDANLLAIHAKRSTIMEKDMVLVRRMRGRCAVGFEMGDN